VTARRLQHVSVQVPRPLVETCARFYVEALGMRRIPNLAGLAWFQFGDGDHVHLLEGPGGDDLRAHLALQVDDLAATLERCRALGREPEQSDDLWGAERWFVRDPAGNNIELFATPPPPV
jgi:catechol 2,3-dioxygenase-like lactoylglutathione lyase family enzyme